MPTILCVDDSPKTLRLLSAILQLCGYRVLTSGDTDTALRVASLKPFDLAILDYQLPSGNGTSLARAIKKMKPDVPIMLFSGALPLATDDLDAIDECVHKGESVDDMLHKVRALLQTPLHDQNSGEHEPAHA
jgi:CheY-like chemotaxis protein